MPKAKIEDFIQFISASPSSYHAAAAIARRLEAGGYCEQLEADPFDITPGGHFVVRDGAVIAYWIPDELSEFTALRIVGAHTDSPGFKLKPNPEHAAFGWSQVGMEVYGGPIYNSWLDREFGLAGRVFTADGDEVLVQTPAWLRIPQVAIHLDRSVNDTLHLDPQLHLMPVYALSGGTTDLLGAVAKQVGVPREAVIGHDLFAYVAQPPEVFGLRGEFLAAGHLDNLSSVYAGLSALLDADHDTTDIAVLACFDHEEIGSATRSGASGPFLQTLLERLAGACGFAGDDAYRLFARSWVISADAGHGVHPNYPQYHDPDERPLLNGGPLLKVNAKQRYTTEGRGAALWHQLCETAGVPYQVFVSNNAMPCGSTIGPLTAVRLGINTLDAGIPLLSMHSAREMCGVDDPGYLAKVLTTFYSGIE